MGQYFFDRTTLPPLDISVKSMLAAKNYMDAAEFISRMYLDFTKYVTEMNLSKFLSGSILIDEVENTATDVLLEVTCKIRAGTSGFNGTARFSTYLSSAVEFHLSSKNRIYYPSKVNRAGPAVEKAYFLLHVKNEPIDAVKENIMNGFILSSEKADEIITLVDTPKYRLDELVRQSKRSGGNRHLSLNRKMSDDSRSTVIEAVADTTPTPEEEYIKKEQKKLFRMALDSLKEPERMFMTLTLFEGKTTAQAEEILGIKNGKYIKNKAQKALMKALHSII